VIDLELTSDGQIAALAVFGAGLKGYAVSNPLTSKAKFRNYPTTHTVEELSRILRAASKDSRYSLFAYGAATEEAHLCIPVNDIQDLPLVTGQPERAGYPHDAISEVVYSSWCIA